MSNKTGLKPNVKENEILSVLGISEERAGEIRDWVFCERGMHSHKGADVKEFTKDLENPNELAYSFYLYGQFEALSNEDGITTQEEKEEVFEEN